MTTTQLEPNEIGNVRRGWQFYCTKMGRRRERNKLRINKRNIILNNYTMPKVIQQNFNI